MKQALGDWAKEGSTIIGERNMDGLRRRLGPV